MLLVSNKNLLIFFFFSLINKKNSFWSYLSDFLKKKNKTKEENSFMYQFNTVKHTTLEYKLNVYTHGS